MKNAPHGDAGRGAEYNDSGAALPVPFQLIALERVEYGSKRATGKIEVLGLGSIEFDYFQPPSRAAFVASRSVRSKYGGQFERTVAFEAEFSAAVLEAVQSRLSAEDDGTR